MALDMFWLVLPQKGYGVGGGGGSVRDVWRDHVWRVGRECESTQPCHPRL